MNTSRSEVRDWLFRGLMFEAEADRFRSAGTRVGADQRESEKSLLEETLAPFGIDMRNEALLMARLYALVYCFERSHAHYGTTVGPYGTDWWNLKIPSKIKQYAENRQKDAQENSWLEGEKKALLGFVDFGHLSSIIVENWDDFSDLVPSQLWIKQRFDELEKARNFVAHNRLLLPGEFQRVEMYVNDWNRMVGL